MVNHIVPDGFLSAFRCFAQEMFERGEDLFDRLEVGLEGGQEDRPCPSRPDDRGRVTARFVQAEDVAFSQRRDQDVLDIGEKDAALDRPADPQRTVIASRCKAATKVMVFQCL